MKNKILFVLAVFFGSFFIWQGLYSKVLISEIKTSGSSSTYDEYIELYNNSTSTVSLAGWYLHKMSKSGIHNNYSLGNFSSDASINPFGYYLVAHENYVVVGTTTANHIYNSNNTIADDNNGLLLFNNNDELQDILVWGTVSTSLSYGSSTPNLTITKCLARKPNDGNGNGQDNFNNADDFFETTCDPQNSSSTPRPFWEPTTTTTDPGTTIDPGTDPPTTTPTSTPITDTSTLWQNIKINEFVSTPIDGENEWVEFFNNNTSSLDISGGYLCDEKGVTSTVASCKTINGIINPLSWFWFDLDTRSFLNNDQDSVILRNLSGEEIDKIDYNGKLTPIVGQSYARKIDGQDTDSSSDWAITTSITKNSTNTIKAPITPVSSGGGGSNYTIIKEEEEPILYTTSDKIILNEIYPDPIGSDTLDEFIEIKNIGTEVVDLTGWSVSDTVKKHVLSGVLSPGQLVVYKREKTGISLNNSTPEEVKLADPSGKLIESVSYKFAPEGQSYVKNASSTWAWTTEISLGLENKVTIVDNVGITVNIIYPNSAEIGEVVIFDASESSDKNAGQLDFLWNFSDNSVFYGEEVGKVFTTSGIFSVKLTVSSTKSEPVDKTVNIKVGLGLIQTETGVIISEIFPNPDGVDKGEFIELFNTGSSTVDLAGWEIKNKNGKIFKILTGTKIEPGKFLIFYQDVTKMTLGNESEKITLTDKDGNVIDLVKYEKAPSGQSYSFFEDNWFWNDEITPGRLVENQEKNKIEKTNSNSVGSKKTYQIKSLADARESAVKDLVITQGVVAVLPNIFSTQYIYIVDGDVGLQVYNFKKDWPELKIGDQVKIIGEISQASGVKRIKTKTRNDVVKIGFVTTTPLEIKTLDILEDINLGALVKVSGEITAIKTSVIYLDDGNNEATIYLKKNAMIDRKKYKVGQTIEVTGILEAGTSGLQIWPRQNEDLRLLVETFLSDETTLQTENNSKETANNYLSATLGGFSALLFGFFLKNKGTIIKGAITLAGKLIKRG